MRFPVPLINHGRNAGQPRRIVDVLLDRLADVRDVLLRMKNAGYEPIRVDIDGTRPSIEMHPHPDLRTLAEEGIATYYIYRPRQRVGQWLYGGVRITWTEEVAQ